MTKVLSERWKSCDAAEKARYADIAAEDKRRYEAERKALGGAADKPAARGRRGRVLAEVSRRRRGAVASTPRSCRVNAAEPSRRRRREHTRLRWSGCTYTNIRILDFLAIIYPLRRLCH